MHVYNIVTLEDDTMSKLSAIKMIQKTCRSTIVTLKEVTKLIISTIEMIQKKVSH